MDKWIPLRGRGIYERLYREGRQLDAQIVRGYYLTSEETPARIQVAFAVSSRLFNSVQRHRIKRLMREAFRKEWSSPQEHHRELARSEFLLFVFKGKQRAQFHKITFQTVHGSIATLCSALRSSL